jgi:hypothetical protein
MTTSKRPTKTFPASRDLCNFRLPSYIRRRRSSEDEDDLKAIALHLNLILRSEKLLRENPSATKQKELESKHLDNLKALELFWRPRVSSMSLKPRLWIGPKMWLRWRSRWWRSRISSTSTTQKNSCCEAERLRVRKGDHAAVWSSLTIEMKCYTRHHDIQSSIYPETHFDLAWFSTAVLSPGYFHRLNSAECSSAADGMDSYHST